MGTACAGSLSTKNPRKIVCIPHDAVTNRATQDTTTLPSISGLMNVGLTFIMEHRLGQTKIHKLKKGLLLPFGSHTVRNPDEGAAPQKLRHVHQ